ncbi:hypothetical protein BV25DRAFT_1832280 [Artomyces pyxidatus]|uniref:Uncharacterized protein n=1 Tax=Artomyces pyxidatus TaxID=48021 RepID=A0ACB8SKJ2_9AGAM|nr:hypothetical protein BV25DRAFT_1832280 [Artomyces pyxidatus]
MSHDLRRRAISVSNRTRHKQNTCRDQFGLPFPLCVINNYSTIQRPASFQVRNPCEDRRQEIVRQRTRVAAPAALSDYSSGEERQIVKSSTPPYPPFRLVPIPLSRTAARSVSSPFTTP